MEISEVKTEKESYQRQISLQEFPRLYHIALHPTLPTPAMSFLKAEPGAVMFSAWK